MDNTLTDEALEQKIDRILEFTFCLYGLQYKKAKSLNSRINGLITRALPKNDFARESRDAMTLSRQISASFAMYGALPLTWNDVIKFKEIVEKFALDVKNLIQTSPNPFCLGTRALRYRNEWNKMVRIMESQFLEGFGDIHASELCILKSELSLYLVKFRKAKSAPSELSILHDKRNQTAITKSIDAHIECQKMMADL